ncbi:hypothetical protein BSKO_05344 [Bryopsis sp. KO-2023]|nr:hypothetical protein BSKO_05344 [Bryopsis sp. KO-2023]
MMGSKGRSCGCKGPGTRKSRDRFYNSEDFMINCFKVLPCFKKYRHDWWVCPYAHEGETAKRRDPKKFQYVGVACPDAKQGKPCPREDECPCTHNVFEYWLHPTRFRTAFCGRGIHCTRPFCFFAHSLNEMRKPSLDDLLPVIQGNSLFNEEMLKHALEDHKRDVARLGGKDTCSEFLDLSFLQVPSGDVDPFAEGGSPGDSPLSLSPREVMRHMTPPRHSSMHSPNRGSTRESLHLRDIGYHSPMRDSSYQQSPLHDSGYHSPMRDTTYHSPMRDTSYNSPVHHRRPARDSYMRSPRDLSPGPAMDRGRYHRRSEDSNPGMLPNMQSPREVLGYMNSVLKNTSPRDLSPENLRYVQSLRAEAAALMTATPSPRDLSPHARPFNIDAYGMHSPRGLDAHVHTYDAGVSPSDASAAQMRDASGFQGVDSTALLEAMSVLRDMSPSAGHMDGVYGANSGAGGMSPMSREGNWRGRDASGYKAQGGERQRRTAGVYNGAPSTIQSQGQAARSASMHTHQSSSLSEVREILEALQRSNSGAGGLMGGQFGRSSLDGMHTSVPMQRSSLDGMHSSVPMQASLDGLQSSVPFHASLEALQNLTLPVETMPMSNVKQGVALEVAQNEALQEILLRESLCASPPLDAVRASPPLDGRKASPAPSSARASPVQDVGTPTEATDAAGIPPSLQAVLRSLSKEDSSYEEDGKTSKLSRPFSSLSGLW